MELHSFFTVTETNFFSTKLGFYFLYNIIATILLFSGFSKIIYPENFLNVSNITLTFLSTDLIVLAAIALLIIEIAIGLMIILKLKVKETVMAVSILFSDIALSVVYRFITRFDEDYGCFWDRYKKSV